MNQDNRQRFIISMFILSGVKTEDFYLKEVQDVIAAFVTWDDDKDFIHFMVNYILQMARDNQELINQLLNLK